MGINFGKAVLILIFSLLVFASSCKNEYYDDKLQVYDEDGAKFNATFDLVGLPSEMLDSGYYPWKLYGRIVNGKMDINFPDVKLELPEGVQLCEVSIERKNYSSTKFCLHKRGADYDDYSRVYIYYATDDSITYDGIALKAGWNFVEELRNPDWVYGNDEPFYITGLISRNINDVLSEGFRWRVEFGI